MYLMMRPTLSLARNQEARKPELPRRLRPVLMELLSGVPDLTASRRLNMSPRTYSRRVAELLDYLGVATRFQAGAEIARRGWAPEFADVPPAERVTQPPSL